MKLYDTKTAPNPRRTRIFLAEKGITVPTEQVDMTTFQHRTPEYTAINPFQRMPALVLDDGTVITETVSICRYLEDLHPEPPLFGTGAVGRAQTDMWTRRVEFVVMAPVGAFWRHAHPRTAALLTQYRDFGLSNQDAYASALKWMDRELADRPFVTGETFGMADICLLSTVDFATWIGLPMPPELTALAAWPGRVTARPSAAA